MSPARNNKRLKNVGFDTAKYLSAQARRIMRIIEKSPGKLYIEFGGKIIQDKHAARVLPGYQEDAKFELITKLCNNGEIIFVVSAKDILRGRVRGDFGIKYDGETIRVLKELKKRGLRVRYIAISLLEPEQEDLPLIKNFIKELSKKNFQVFLFYSDNNYPGANFRIDDLKNNPFIKTKKRIVAIISPGGGSGKFGICLNQLYHEMSEGNSPHYLKFETFPICNLPIHRPLNLAYMAASADFYDVVMKDKRSKDKKATSYNRDLENYELLNRLARFFPKNGKHLKKLSSATNMGINMISSGIINDELVQKEAAAEIARRLIRYKFEVKKGQENPSVLARVRAVLKML